MCGAYIVRIHGNLAYIAIVCVKMSLAYIGGVKMQNLRCAGSLLSPSCAAVPAATFLVLDESKAAVVVDQVSTTDCRCRPIDFGKDKDKVNQFWKFSVHISIIGSVDRRRRTREVLPVIASCTSTLSQLADNGNPRHGF